MTNVTTDFTTRPKTSPFDFAVIIVFLLHKWAASPLLLFLGSATNMNRYPGG